jgi:hypothetical protein
MDAPFGNSYGHSADVRMSLFVNGHILNISHLGPNYLILRNPVAHEPTDAEISLSIDGHENKWRVRLVNGISLDALKTAIEPLGASEKVTHV